MRREPDDLVQTTELERRDRASGDGYGTDAPQAAALDARPLPAFLLLLRRFPLVRGWVSAEQAVASQLRLLLGLHATAFLLFTALALVMHPVHWPFFAFANFILSMTLARWRATSYLEGEELIRRARSVSVISFGLVLLCYSQLSIYQGFLHIEAVEARLIVLDHRLFGFDVVAAAEATRHGLLSEILQGSYVLFYVWPVLFAVLCWKQHWRRMLPFALVTCGAFYFTYVMYLLFPARSPYRIVEEAVTLDGVVAFDFLRQAIHQLEVTVIDCFPSGHVLIGGICAFALAMHWRRLAPWLLVWFALCTAATVYLRYHYIIDVAVSLAILPLFLALYRGLDWLTQARE